ncbi:MAG: hypothetical protein AAF602_32720, partial [Myxococcota bacterium]
VVEATARAIIGILSRPGTALAWERRLALAETGRALPIEDPHLLGWLYHVHGATLDDGDRTDDALVAYDQGLDQARRARDPHVEATLLKSKAILLDRLFRRDEAQATLTESHRLHPSCNVEYWLGQFAYVRGRPEEAWRRWDRVRQRAREEQDPVQVALAGYALSYRDRERGHHEASLAQLAEAETELAGQHRSLRAMIWLAQSRCASALGQYRRAAVRADDAAKSFARLGEVLSRDEARAQAALIEGRRGRFEQAGSALERLIEERRVRRQSFARFSDLICLASIRLDQERLADARRLLDEVAADEMAMSTWMLQLMWTLQEGRYWLTQHEPARTLACVEASERHPRLESFVGGFETLRAVAWGELGHEDRAEVILTDVIDSSDIRVVLDWARLTRSALSERAGRRSEAVADLHDVIDAAEAGGAAGIEMEARLRLVRLGIADAEWHLARANALTRDADVVPRLARLLEAARASR